MLPGHCISIDVKPMESQMENAVRTLYFDGVALKQYGIQLQPSVAAKTTPIYLDLLIFAHSCFV